MGKPGERIINRLSHRSQGAITLALVAHDRYKGMLACFVLDHRADFNHFYLMATQETGKVVQKWTGLKVHLLEHGPDGGYRQIGELAAANEVQAVIFFRDPYLPLGSEGPDETDFAGLLQVCDEREIPLATNRPTAEALLFFLQNSPDRAIVTARPWGLSEL